MTEFCTNPSDSWDTPTQRCDSKVWEDHFLFGWHLPIYFAVGTQDMSAVFSAVVILVHSVSVLVGIVAIEWGVSTATKHRSDRRVPTPPEFGQTNAGSAHVFRAGGHRGLGREHGGPTFGSRGEVSWGEPIYPPKGSNPQCKHGKSSQNIPKKCKNDLGHCQAKMPFPCFFGLFEGPGTSQRRRFPNSEGNSTH